MTPKSFCIVGAAALTLAACGSGDGADSAANAYALYDADGSGSLDGDEALDLAADEASELTYQDAGAPYGCTDDCSGHEAGYQWAIDNGVTDPSDCGGNSDSFIEGCQSYGEAIEERAEELQAEDY